MAVSPHAHRCYLSQHAFDINGILPYFKLFSKSSAAARLPAGFDFDSSILKNVFQRNSREVALTSKTARGRLLSLVISGTNPEKTSA